MSILIKGVEMPKSCWDCPMKMNCDDCEGWECVCVPLQIPIGYWGDLLTDKRRDDCPLVTVPKHGRLIDGDYLKHTHCAECTLYPDKCLEKTADGCDWVSIIHLRMCPTIIPSDKEDGDESRT